jgi:GR25 family glycosyltransferase involved in LPS biosynthesis
VNGFDFFDNVYYINLASRPDRNSALLAECFMQGFVPQRIEAETGENHHLAFNASQYKALSQAQGDKVLILEDDCVFRYNYHLDKAIAELPEDWHLLYLGANVHDNGAEQYGSHLLKLNSCWTSHAIGYSRKAIDFLLSNWDPTQFPIFDQRLNEFPLKRFLVAPMIADQAPGFSDIWQQETLYGFYNNWSGKIIHV